MLTIKAHSGRVGRRPMSGKRWSWTVALCLLASTAASAQFSGPAPGPGTPINPTQELTLDPAILYPGAREIRLGAGDLIGIHIFGVPDYAPVGRIALDGTIQLPLIGLVPVGGLPLHGAEDLVAQKLIAAGMYRSPQVTINLTESPNQVVTVSGELHAVVPVYGEKHLIDVLAAAGPMPVTASHRITIDRPGVAQPIVVDLGPNPQISRMSNIPVFAGDTVIVSRVGVIYLLGAFTRQGAIPMQPNTPLTLMQVASLGGGLGFEGKYDDLQIVRSTGEGRTIVKMNVKKVLKGKEPDPVLQADDIVYLPPSAVKAFIKVGGVGVLLGVVSTLLFIVRP